MGARRIASFGMYDAPWLAPANDALWTAVAARLRAAGVEGVPDRLERGRPSPEIWRDSDLLVAQTCGYPLVTALRGAVTVVARPRYDLPGCAGGWHRSLLVVRAESPARSLADLRDGRAALNDPSSNSGMNLFRHAVAPLAGGAPFFGAVVETGGHLLSLAALRDGRADVAAVDCVTFGLAARHRPEAVAGLRVLAETAPSPTLPFVTAAGAPLEAVAVLWDALARAVADPANAGAVATLGLAGVEPAAFDDYRVLLDREAEAARANYPALA